MTLTYAELFAGAGGLSRGLEAAGFHCVAHAEIEPHARAVLRYHWPDTRLDGDVTQVNGADYAGITLLSGGSPCQDLSVAGKRAGLAGGRSGLFHEQCRIWQESGAPYLLWENVAGAFSSNSGKDFATVLSTLVGATIPVPADGWATGGVAAGRDAVAAWRVLDLQHFGPPQRRVRVFVLAARAGGVDPAEVLALSEGVCGHPSPRQQAREGTAGRAAGGVGAGGVAFGIGSHAGAADAKVSNKSHANGGPSGMGINEELSNSLRAGRTTAVAHVLAFHHTQTPISGEMVPAIGRPTNGMGVFVDPGMESWKAASVIEPMCARDYKDAAAIVLNMQSSDASASGICPTLDTGMAKGNRGPTLFHGANDEGKAVPSEDIANAPLFALRRTTDTEAIRQTAGRSERIHAAEVLRPAVHGSGVRREGEYGETGVVGSVAFAEGNSEGIMPAMWDGEREGRASQGRQSVEQCHGEPRASVQELSREGAQNEGKVQCGWVPATAQTERLLRYAQPEDQEVGRSASSSSKSASVGRPRRLLPIEAERLMSWPDDWTRYGRKDDGTVYELSDTARYRLCGNGVGSVCVEWIATRLADAIAQQNGLPMQEAA